MRILRTPSKIRTNRKTITFTGGAGAGLAGSPITVFTVTGQIYIHGITAFCTTLLTESGATATVSLGTTNQVSRFVSSTNSVDIDANEWWVTTTPTVGSIDLPDALQSVLVSENIIINPLVTNTTAGVLEIVLVWEPISQNGSVS